VHNEHIQVVDYQDQCFEATCLILIHKLSFLNTQVLNLRFKEVYKLDYGFVELN